MGRDARLRRGGVVVGRRSAPAQVGPVGYVRRPRPREKVIVGYPVGGSVTLAFHAASLRLLAAEMAKGEERLLAKITHSQGLYVADNRTLLCERMLEARPAADWLLQLDTDIHFEPDLLERLLDLAHRAGAKVLAASVPLGSDQFPTCGFKLTDTPGVWDCVPQIEGDVMPVDGVATAVLLVHRTVLEDVARREGQAWLQHLYVPVARTLPALPPASWPTTATFASWRAYHDDAHGMLAAWRAQGRDLSGVKYSSMGEDLALSFRAQEAGHGVFCGYVPGLRHFKTKALSHDSERASELAGEDGGVGELVREGT